MRRVFALTLLAVVAAVVAGCGAAGTSTPVATDHVQMAKSYRFDPTVIKIKAGDSVTWTNNDNFTHTVKVEDGPDHKVGRGDSVTIKFAKPGTFHYVCTLHSHDMHGQVIVQ